jgi:hypothetical protein
MSEPRCTTTRPISTARLTRAHNPPSQATTRPPSPPSVGVRGRGLLLASQLVCTHDLNLTHRGV